MNRENDTMILPKKELNSNAVIKNNTAEASQTPVMRKTPIISFSGKKKRRRFSFRKLIIPLFLFFLLYLFLSMYIESILKNEINELAKIQAEKHLAETVNREIGSLAQEGLLQYDNMVQTIRDEKGEVIYLEVNTALLNQAKSTLIARIDESLEKNKKITLSVPVGSLSGWKIFSGFGFPVRVRLFPIGITSGDIYTVLEDCGINQTRHLIQIHVHTKMMIVLSGENTIVESEISLPIGERVLVGDVPEIFLDSIGAS